MARMIPDLSDMRLREFRSRAETRFYRACKEQLPDDMLVIHSVSWIYRDGYDRLREGEADFTIVSPKAGILAVEVKGGGVSFDADSGTWHSIDRFSNKHSIKDPFRQASNERHAIKDQLAGSSLWRRWRGTKVLIGHAVMLPDIHDSKALVSPDRKPEFIGVDADMEALAQWVSKVFDFWRTQHDDVLGAQGLEIVEKILCNSVEVRPALYSLLSDAEQTRLRLTNAQAKILRTIGGRRRAVISGGAGTGKTLIAMEKARQLAADGQSVLLLCYNRPLADALSLGFSDAANVTVMSFHQLCESRMHTVSMKAGRNLKKEAEEAYPGTSNKHYFDVQMPFALALSNELLDEKYDSLIVDEAQDFSDDYWFSLEELLRDPKNGSLYIFIDENQSLYRKHANLPVSDDPYYLTVNCRNTAPIHRAGYAYYSGELVDEPDLDGQAIERLAADGNADQAAAIASIVRDLLEKGVSAEDIAVLIAKRPKATLYELLMCHRLPSGVSWSVESHRRPNSVLVDTVARFKGLESPVVLLWIGDEVIADEQWETIYVGTTRAKSLLYVIGSKQSTMAIGSEH